MQANRLIHSSSLYLISNVASRAIGFLMLPLYSRFLSPAEYGLVELIELTIQIAALCIGLQSIGGAMIRIFHESSEQRWQASVVSTALVGGVAANGLLAIITIFAATPISTYVLHSPGSENLVRVSVLALMLSNLAEVSLIYFRLQDWVERCVAYSLVQLAAAVALNIFFIVHLRLGVWAFVLSKIITCGIGCAYLTWRTVQDVGFSWNGQAARKMFKFGGPLVISNVAFFVIHFGDRWFLSGLRSMEEVGSYALAYRFAFAITLLVGEPFGKVWSVNLYNYTSLPNWQAQFASVARYLTFTLCVAGLGLAIFGDQIIRRMAASAYHPAAAVIPILVCAYICRELGDFFRNVLYINKRSALVGRIALLAAVANTALNALAIGRLGMHGAAISTLLTWAFYLALCWLAARREHGIPFAVRPFALATAAGMLTYLGAISLPSAPAVIHVGLQAALLGQFMAVLWLLNFFPPQDQNYIKNKLQDVCTGLGLWVKQRVT